MTGFDPKAFVQSLTGAPGVYRMLNDRGEVLYVGKARNLRKRVGSYFARGAHSGKTHAMLQRVAGIEVTLRIGTPEPCGPRMTVTAALVAWLSRLVPYTTSRFVPTSRPIGADVHGDAAGKFDTVLFSSFEIHMPPMTFVTPLSLPPALPPVRPIPHSVCT